MGECAGTSGVRETGRGSRNGIDSSASGSLCGMMFSPALLTGRPRASETRTHAVQLAILLTSSPTSFCLRTVSGELRFSTKSAAFIELQSTAWMCAAAISFVRNSSSDTAQKRSWLQLTHKIRSDEGHESHRPILQQYRILLGISMAITTDGNLVKANVYQIRESVKCSCRQYHRWGRQSFVFVKMQCYRLTAPSSLALSKH